MNYAEIKEYDTANGPGVRLSLFVSGCPHHCKGCFNEDTWDFNFGKPYTRDVEDYILEKVSSSVYQGMTLLGGEPLEPENQKGLLSLVIRFKKMFPEKDLWCFTGYLYDKDLLGQMWDTVPETRELLSRIDVLVDGRYVQELHSVNLLYKGSSNQRTIDVQKSLSAGRIITWDPGDTSMSPRMTL